MKQTMLNFFYSNVGRAIGALFLLVPVWLWHVDLNNPNRAALLNIEQVAYGQVFDLGLVIGALFGFAFCLLLISRRKNSAKAAQ